jgi:HTH-type transcriptional regulator/antitoxin HipB
MKADLKNTVREHRRLSGLSQSQLAKLAGVGKTVIFDIEHGKESVQFDTLKKVLAALNIKFILQSPVLESRGNEQAKPNPPAA